jgi:hypothetical protein
MTRRWPDISKPCGETGTSTAIGAGLGMLAGVIVLVIVGLFLAIIFSVRPVHAEWKPQYANAPQSVRDWYQAQELTPEAQQRFPFKSCCAQSDRVRTKFKVGGAGNDEWWWLSGDTWKRVPNDVIHWGVRTPDGDAVLFVIGGEPVCFYPPDSGI